MWKIKIYKMPTVNYKHVLCQKLLIILRNWKYCSLHATMYWSHITTFMKSASIQSMFIFQMDFLWNPYFYFLLLWVFCGWIFWHTFRWIFMTIPFRLVHPQCTAYNTLFFISFMKRVFSAVAQIFHYAHIITEPCNWNVQNVYTLQRKSTQCWNSHYSTSCNVLTLL